MVFRAAIVLMTVFWFSTLCAGNEAQAQGSRVGAFPDVDRMEAELKKGLSTKADVEALLGPPVGRGGALSAVEPGRPRDVWVYGEFGWSIIDMSGSAVRLHFDQQLLMVYFVDGLFDGFWWHGNAAAMTGEASN